MRTKLAYFLCAVLMMGATSVATGQETGSESESKSELDRVVEISEMTGRPIFAVAGRST